MTDAVWQTDLPGLPPPKRGKVRDVYDLGETLLIVACDRISAYDHVLVPPIPGKGKLLTQLSNYWFRHLPAGVGHHLLATEVGDFPSQLRGHEAILAGRSVLVRRAAVIPFECVARGYLAGSAYREYRQSGRACGFELPAGLERASRLASPLFTPATKAAEGHDENIDFATLAEALGEDLATRIRDLTLTLYALAAARAETAGLILADTKIELGWHGDELLVIDELFTPDSSRYWEASEWRPGEEPVSFDKQYVRNWLDDSGWDRESAPPALPAEIVDGTLARYVEAFRRLTGAEPRL